jgi:hypothetical protein
MKWLIDLIKYLFPWQDTVPHDTEIKFIPLSPLPVKQPITPTPMPIVSPSKISTWAHLIEQGEGADQKSNNPGNLKVSSLTASWGAKPFRQASDGGWLAKFDTYEKGFTALCNFLTLGCENELIAFHKPEQRTLSGFTKVYAGNPPQGYIDRIVKGMGGDPKVQISTFLHS